MILPAPLRRVSPPPPANTQKHKGKPLTFRLVLEKQVEQKLRPDPRALPETDAPRRVDATRHPVAEPLPRAVVEIEPGALAPAQPLDPMLAALAAPMSRVAEAPVPVPVPGANPLPDDLALERIVKRLSWGGNGKRGSARIELGAGSLAGATLLVHAEGREVTIEVEGADPSAVEALARRISHRLDQKGLSLREVRQG